MKEKTRHPKRLGSLSVNEPKPKNPDAVALGKIGGSRTSEQKAFASRKNGALGGRPRKDRLCS